MKKEMYAIEEGESSFWMTPEEIEESEKKLKERQNETLEEGLLRLKSERKFYVKSSQK